MAKVVAIRAKKVDPNSGASSKTLKSGPDYMKMNPKTTSEQNAIKAKNNLSEAVKYKNSLTTGQKSTKPVYDKESGSQTSKSVSPKEVAKADSVISASRAYLRVGQKKK